MAYPLPMYYQTVLLNNSCSLCQNVITYLEKKCYYLPGEKMLLLTWKKMLLLTWKKMLLLTWKKKTRNFNNKNIIGTATYN